MLSYRLSTIKDFHCGFKPVLSHSKPHTFPTFFGDKKNTKYAQNTLNVFSH